MKYLLAFSFFVTSSIFAQTMECISTDGEYSFVTTVDFAARKMDKIEYFRYGSKYKSFENLKLVHERSIFTGRKDNYEVVFPESARYMTFIIEKDGNIHGYFLPKNSILSVERNMTCKNI